MVTAQLGPFVLPGQQIDVTVSSMGNAKSLRGGTLLMTPMKGSDGNVYAIAQGNVVIGGAGASSGGSKTQVNQLSAGRVPNGAIVERAVEGAFSAGPSVRFLLHTADFTVARRVAEAINAELGGSLAAAADARVVEVQAPNNASARVTFLARLENLQVEIPGAAARVIINARTGSVVMNQAVRLEQCAVAHGSLTVTISNTPIVGQPGLLLPGAVTQQTDVKLQQDGMGIMALPAGANLADVVKALNLLGASPQDLISILQAMQSSGSLRAELEII
jgi:flagellar P-ring protein precursor FlgI